jgi:hypothetical protein
MTTTGGDGDDELDRLGNGIDWLPEKKLCRLCLGGVKLGIYVL